MMFALGFDPIKSILACLIANTVPTPFGSIAIPTTTMASLTGLDLSQLGIYTAMMNAILDITCPFLVVMVIAGGPKALKGVFGVTLISGLALLIPEYLICIAIGPELAVIAPSIIIMKILKLYLQSWVYFKTPIHILYPNFLNRKRSCNDGINDS